jgi:hypothetical protein
MFKYLCILPLILSILACSSTNSISSQDSRCGKAVTGTPKQGNTEGFKLKDSSTSCVCRSSIDERAYCFDYFPTW